MAAVEQDITAEQGAALAVTLTGAGASLQGRTLRMHVRSKVGVTTTKLVAGTGDGRLTVGADPYTTAALAIGSDVMAAVSVTLPVEYWVYDVESYTTAADVRREWFGRWTITRDVTRDTEADTEDSLAGLVRYDTPQSLTATQAEQAWDNISGDELARDAIGAALVAGSNVTITVSDAGDTITIASSGGGGGSGDVVGPASATDDRLAAFDGVTGKLIKQGTVTATAVASHLSSTSNPHSVTAAQVGADPTGTAAAAVSAHAGAVDPHGDRAYADGLAGNYATAGHNHTGVYQPLATVLTNTTAAFTTAQEAKLSGIEAAADVTDASNVGAAIDGATAKTTPVDADTVPLIDSAAGNVLKKLSWANIKATAKAYFDTLYATAAQGTDDRTASGLRSATTVVSVSAATAPSAGQVLQATSSTAATWQTPSGGSSNTKWVGAGELIPRVTNGAGIDGEELATNDINLDYLAFDSATSEGAQVSFAWPGAYTTFTAQFHWTAASGSGTVTWTAAARCYADDDALDQAQGTAQSVTDTLLAANDAHKSSATSAVTPGGTVADGNLCVAQFTRDVADTLAVDARLIGVLLSFA